MTPAQIYVLNPGATVTDVNGVTGTIKEVRRFGSSGDPYEGFFSLRWTTRSSDSVLSYDDPIIAKWTGGAAAFSLTSLSPTTFSHTQATILTATGTGFLLTSVMRLDDISDLPTTYVNATTLTWSYPANGFISGAGHWICIRNPGPVDSNLVLFTVT